MKNLFSYADRYMENANWKDLALLKTCLCSMGVVIGASSSDKMKNPLKKCAKFLFIVTYIPLMIKAFFVLFEGKKELE